LLAQDQADRVVVRAEVVDDDAAGAEVLAGTPRVHRARARRRRVVEEAAVEVDGVRAEVLEGQGGAAPELQLHVEAPLRLARAGSRTAAAPCPCSSPS